MTTGSATATTAGGPLSFPAEASLIVAKMGIKLVTIAALSACNILSSSLSQGTLSLLLQFIWTLRALCVLFLFLHPLRGFVCPRVLNYLPPKPNYCSTINFLRRTPSTPIHTIMETAHTKPLKEYFIFYLIRNLD
jgi:hypothetical protein